MYYVIYSITALVLVIVCNPATSNAEAYDHEINVQQMWFAWKVQGSDIHIRLKAKTTSWVGIGFNPTSMMKDANFVIGYVKKGKVSVTDHFGTTQRQHMKDTKLGGSDNVKQAAGKEENGVTEISFVVPLKSGDKKDQDIVVDKDMVVLLAYGAGRDSYRTKHDFRTALKVNLKTGKFSEATGHDHSGHEH